MQKTVRVRRCGSGSWVVEVYNPYAKIRWTVQGIWKTEYEAQLDAALWRLTNGEYHEDLT